MEKLLKIIRLSNHSWFRFVWDGYVLDVDPGYSGPFDSGLLKIIDVDGKSDAILVSHHHFDHVQLDALRHLMKKETQVYAPAICEEVIPFPYHVIGYGSEIKVGPLTLQAVPAYNTPMGHSTRKAHVPGEGNGYVFSFNGFRFYFAGDTDIIPEMSRLGKIDLALLPMGGTYTMDAEEAGEALIPIKPKWVIPMHELGKPRNALMEKANKLGIEVKILEVGQSTII